MAPETRSVDAPPSRPIGSRVRVTVVRGADAGRFAELAPGEAIRVGTQASCQLCVVDDTVSRQHVEVRWEPAGIVLVDLGSYSGHRALRASVHY